jgi:hypothetical protein
VRPLKVWCVGITIGDTTQRNVIVATTTQKEAARLLNVSTTYLRTYGHQTGNQEEIAIATSKPGALFATKDMNYPHVYKEVPKHLVWWLR